MALGGSGFSSGDVFPQPAALPGRAPPGVRVRLRRRARLPGARRPRRRPRRSRSATATRSPRRAPRPRRSSTSTTGRPRRASTRWPQARPVSSRSSTRESADSVIEVLEQNESVMDGEVEWAGVVSVDKDSATVIAATTGTVANKAYRRTSRSPRNFRVKLTLELVDGEWLTSNLEFVGMTVDAGPAGVVPRPAEARHAGAQAGRWGARTDDTARGVQSSPWSTASPRAAEQDAARTAEPEPTEPDASGPTAGPPTDPRAGGRRRGPRRHRPPGGRLPLGPAGGRPPRSPATARCCSAAPPSAARRTPRPRPPSRSPSARTRPTTSRSTQAAGLMTEDFAKEFRQTTDDARRAVPGRRGAGDRRGGGPGRDDGHGEAGRGAGLPQPVHDPEG